MVRAARMMGTPDPSGREEVASCDCRGLKVGVVVIRAAAGLAREDSQSPIKMSKVAIQNVYSSEVER